MYHGKFGSQSRKCGPECSLLRFSLQETRLLPEIVSHVVFLLVASADINLQTTLVRACRNRVNWICRLRLTCSPRRPVWWFTQNEMPAILGKWHYIQEQYRCYWNIPGYTVNRMVKITRISPERCWPTFFSLGRE